MYWVSVGGQALRHHGLRNNTVDCDIWVCDGVQAKTLTGADVSVVSQEILSRFEMPTRVGNHASVNDLYTIKLSHLVYDIFWWKHVQDVLLLIKSGAVLNKPLYNLLCQHWEDQHEQSKSKLSLYRTKDKFFDDFVRKRYEHDYLHELVARDSVPIYTLCLKDGHEVFIDKEKWMSLPFEQQVKMFKEEIAVIALERWVIPSNCEIPICHAWNKALHKTVVSLTKGWASRFIVENLVLFLTPLHEDIQRALVKLNLKEKGMNYSDFEQMIRQRFDEQYPDGLDSGYYRIESGEYLNLNEILLEGFEDIGVELIEQEGGGEGGAESCHSILKIDGKYYMVSYSYFSHHGFDFDYASVKEVFPQQKMVTVYE